MINHKKGGFTLIELLVVIAIIGILSSVVLASLNTARQKSRDARRISDLGQVQLALELYFDSCSQYPPTLTLGANAGCSGGNTLATFISPIPTDPVGGAVYYYYAAHTGTVAICMDYHLGATLEDAGHANFDSDADVTSAPGSGVCTLGGAFVTGADPVYDLAP